MTGWKQKLARIFRPGSMPDDVKSQLESEGLLLLAERIRISVVYRNFKAPGRRYWRAHKGAVGSLGLSSRRIAGFAFSKMIIHTPYNEPKFKMIVFKAEGKYLSASFDASAFDPEHSGHVEIRFYLPNAEETADFLNDKKKGKISSLFYIRSTRSLVLKSLKTVRKSFHSEIKPSFPVMISFAS
jgi:hypothetical protein